MLYPDVEMVCITLCFTLYISGPIVTFPSDLGASSSVSVCRNQVPHILIYSSFYSSLVLYVILTFFPWRLIVRPLFQGTYGVEFLTLS